MIENNRILCNCEFEKDMKIEPDLCICNSLIKENRELVKDIEILKNCINKMRCSVCEGGNEPMDILFNQNKKFRKIIKELKEKTIKNS